MGELIGTRIRLVLIAWWLIALFAVLIGGHPFVVVTAIGVATGLTVGTLLLAAYLLRSEVGR